MMYTVIKLLLKSYYMKQNIMLSITDISAAKPPSSPWKYRLNEEALMFILAHNNVVELRSYINESNVGVDKIIPLIGKIPEEATKMCIDIIFDSDEWLYHNVTTLHDILVSAVYDRYYGDNIMLEYSLSEAVRMIEEGDDTYTLEELIRRIDGIYDDIPYNYNDYIDVSGIFTSVKEYIKDGDFIHKYLLWIKNRKCFEAHIDHASVLSGNLEMIKYHVDEYLDAECAEMIYDNIFKWQLDKDVVDYYMTLPLSEYLNGHKVAIFNCIYTLHRGDMVEFKSYMQNLMRDFLCFETYHDKHFMKWYIFRFALYYCSYEVALFMYRDYQPIELIQVQHIIPSDKSLFSIFNDMPHADKLCGILRECDPNKKYIYLDNDNYIVRTSKRSNSYIDIENRKIIFRYN
jgi:hypothetical protein